MKKYLYLIFVLLVIPFSVYAEECNDTKVTIKDLTLKKSLGNTEELSPATLLNEKINLNIKMYEVGDSIEYTFKVKNDSSEDFYIDNSINAKHIEYTISSKDGSLKIPVGEEKEFSLVAIYNEELEKTDFKAGKYDASSIVQLSVIPDSIYNPKTGSFFFKILGLILIVTCVMIFTQNKKVRLSILILACAFIPYNSHAACKVNIGLNSNVIIGYVVPNPCTYDGNLVQGAEFTHDGFTYRYMQENGVDGVWTNIDLDGWGVRITDPNSTEPIVAKTCTSINDKPIVSTSRMFYQSRATSIDASHIDSSNIYRVMCMFQYANSLEKLDLSNFDFSKVTGFESALFMNLTGGGLSSLKEIDMTGSVLLENCDYAFGGFPSVEKIILDNVDTSNVTDMSNMFRSDSTLTTIDVSSFDTSKVTNFSSMFYGCSSLNSLDLSNFDNISSFSSMIYGCSSLETLDLSGLDFSNYNGSSLFMNLTGGGIANLKTIDMTDSILPPNCNYAFGGLPSVETIILDNVDTFYVTNMNAMFYGDSNITSLDLSSFDTSKVESISAMFYGCTSLTDVNLSSFDTGHATTIAGMFTDCTSLKTVDLSSFSTSTVTNMSEMFKGASQLKTIYVSNQFVTTNVTNSDNMFFGCTSLVGGNGTTYNAIYADKYYARIDQAGSPGYFTKKATS